MPRGAALPSRPPPADVSWTVRILFATGGLHLRAKPGSGTVRVSTGSSSMKKLLLAAVVVTLAAPATARAANVSMRVEDVALGRALASAPKPSNFNMLGLHWIGAGIVAYRTRTLGGRWRAWRQADADNRSGFWHDGNLDWTGASSAVQYRVHGDVRRLRSYAVWSRVLGAPVRAVASAGEPAIVSRAGWNANEEIVRAAPIIAPVLRLAIVHHTAGTNSYTRAEAAAIVRGIEYYHVKGNGWTTSATTFLSIASARSTRGVAAGSTG